ncbi:MAG: hypothetical protein Q9190_001060 [Brigantiaea leucoxantha]
MEQTHQESAVLSEPKKKSALEQVFSHCGLEDVERLVIDSHENTSTHIPFGADGVSVILNSYGEILRMSSVISDEKPQIHCLCSEALDGYDRDLRYLSECLSRANTPGTGFHVRVSPASRPESSDSKPHLGWLNGRWPCFHYQTGAFLVLSILVVKQDAKGAILSHHFKIFNTSDRIESVGCALQLGNPSVNTLSSNGNVWAVADDGPDHVDKPSSGPKSTGKSWKIDEDEHSGREQGLLTGQAWISVFVNGSHVKIDGFSQTVLETPQMPDPDEERDAKESKSHHATQMTLGPGSLGTYSVVYKLHSYRSDESQSPEKFDIDSLLKSETSKNWAFVDEHDFNPMFRRHLEYILGLCTVSEESKHGREYRGPFINDITFESFSQPISDL